MKFKLQDITYELKEAQNLEWLASRGTIFSVIDQTGSGCICFGVQDGNDKYFYKIAGAKTINAEVSQKESIRLLKEATQIYKDIKHPNLIELVEDYELDEFYVVVYRFVDGLCLFDHWNFDMYKKNPDIVTPIQAFKKLDINYKLEAIEVLFSFFKEVHKQNYLAIDFYDSSLIYDFENHRLSICDIDLFQKKPLVNTVGEDYFGTKRLKAPEESKKGAVIDERTNIFTLGAIICDLLSEVNNKKERYEVGHFIINPIEDYSYTKESYNVVRKATNMNRELRYNTIEEFHKAWENCL